MSFGDPGYYNRVVSLIEQVFVADNNIQQQVYAATAQLQLDPQYPNYLAAVLRDHNPIQIRRMACLWLNSHAAQAWMKYAQNTKMFVKEVALHCVEDESQAISKAVGSLIATIAASNHGNELENWPQLLVRLDELLNPAAEGAMQKILGSLSAICKLSEDVTYHMDSEKLNRPLNVLVPKLIYFMGHQMLEIRLLAITSINEYLFTMPAAIVTNLNGILNALFTLANDPDMKMRMCVCQAFVALSDRNMDALNPFLKGIVAFIFACFSSFETNEDLALEAGEFWPNFCSLMDNQNLYLLEEIFPTLFPVLLGGMVYSDVELLDLGDDNAALPDRQQDTAPSQYNYKNQEEDSDEDDEFGDDSTSCWNIRKSCGHSLDRISVTFGPKILPHILPLLEKNFGDSDWKNREAALMALGAISHGCYEGLLPHLSTLVPFLIQLCQDQQPLIRSMACWALSRYSKWIVEQENPEVYAVVIRLFLSRMLDSSKKVQENACTGFSSLEEASDSSQLVPFLPEIIHTIRESFRVYQVRNFSSLFDTVGTLGESVRLFDVLNQQQNMVASLMEPLWAKFLSLDDTDPMLWPFFECLGPVANSLHSLFLPWAPEVFQRCLRIVEHNLILEEQAIKYNSELPHKAFVVSSLDLLANLCEGLGGTFDELLKNTNLIVHLFSCCRNDRAEIRQSAFALFGDIVKFCFGHVRSNLDKFIPLVTSNLKPEYSAVCNNASWSLGECAVKVGPEFQQYVVPILEKVVPILKNDFYQARYPQLMENISITLGRLALVAPGALAPHMAQFAEVWLYYLGELNDDSEKGCAFHGLCLIIEKNPHSIIPCFSSLCNAIASWNNPTDTMNNMFASLLRAYRQLFGANWNAHFNKCSEEVMSILSSRYRV